MKTKFPLKPFDFLVIGIAALLTGYCAFSVYAGPRENGHVLIRGSEGSWLFPLDAEETVEVPGPLGVTVVEIKDMRVHVISSPCANQTCVASGHIYSGGQWTACLPNRVFVMIEDDADGPFVDSGTW
ncbi:MAG: NusG domain II-containing protein [Spirochaetaceae bacterium]|nr:NusG domain II-containing protein [Spirochaetaceae bacterium]